MALTNFIAPAVGSIPYGVEGHKTISYEITEQMERCMPDSLVMSAAYADGLSGVWKGFMELHRLGWINPATETTRQRVEEKPRLRGGCAH